MVSAKRFARVAGWGVLTLAALVFFGHTAEICDTKTVAESLSRDSCPSRARWIIACGVVAASIGFVMLLMSLCFGSKSFFPLVELIASFILVVWLAAGAGVAASIRTYADKRFHSIAATYSLYSTLEVPPNLSSSHSLRHSTRKLGPQPYAHTNYCFSFSFFSSQRKGITSTIVIGFAFLALFSAFLLFMYSLLQALASSKSRVAVVRKDPEAPVAVENVAVTT